MAWLGRLNPVYLAGRHAGVAFMLVAAGLAAGAAWRAFAEPIRYDAAGEAAATVTSAASAFDWEGKGREWRAALADGGTLRILTNNLRHAVKIAATQAAELDGSRLAGELLLLGNGVTFPVSLLTGLAARVGPQFAVHTTDLIRNLDVQSLAAIAADLDPPGGGGGEWDFSFFRSPAGGVPVLARPGATDFYFKVFYRLHSLLNGGREAVNSDEAYRSAVGEVAARLERECRFDGGGGFGGTARRELMREIIAIPVLAANDLYGAGWADGGEAELWSGRWAEAEVGLQPSSSGAGEGLATVRLGFDLYPLASPRDSAGTRIASIAVATAMAYFAAREAAAVTPATPATVSLPAAAPAPTPSPEPEAAPAVEPAPAAPPPARIVVREVPDVAAAAELRAKTRAAEESLLAGQAGLPGLTRRWAAAREDAARISSEAAAARARADRFRERYDEAARAGESEEPAVPEQTSRLLAERDGLARRLAALLLYCTDEHPFVVEVRRSMAALDALLKADDPSRAAAQDAEARATRLANLYLEWETASASADGLDECARRALTDADRIQAELTELEGEVLREEASLASLRAEPVPMRREEISVPAPEAEAAKPAVTAVASAAVAAHPAAPAVAPPPENASPALALVLPAQVAAHRLPPGLTAVWAGLAGGLFAAVAVLIGRELFGKRFYRAAEAERLLGLPVLAALPAYDGKSMRVAAKTVKGEVVAGSAGLTFTPPPVDFAEPPPAAKRGKIRPRGRRPRVAAWAGGILLIALAGWLYRRGPAGFFQPGIRELSVPAFTVQIPAPPEELP